ncbi:hypothetical protein DLAC_04399 [Tieghemostelium lacteum]|uniref:Uncharacterized protein n=1 Tax=Tieghemostelium lacteum TaxID=361077 RepID=A0A151ZJE0_TIELA|nr:hypothetical protein DLAC_04399 [Tieghemostelium lacteum]|eukprot:KYQ94118.1 hypothetical protein DLAC_04399 [Tieghemostelium lacteum]
MNYSILNNGGCSKKSSCSPMDAIRDLEESDRVAMEEQSKKEWDVIMGMTNQFFQSLNEEEQREEKEKQSNTKICIELIKTLQGGKLEGILIPGRGAEVFLNRLAISINSNNSHREKTDHLINSLQLILDTSFKSPHWKFTVWIGNYGIHIRQKALVFQKKKTIDLILNPTSILDYLNVNYNVIRGNIQNINLDEQLIIEYGNRIFEHTSEKLVNLTISFNQYIDDCEVVSLPQSLERVFMIFNHSTTQLIFSTIVQRYLKPLKNIKSLSLSFQTSGLDINVDEFSTCLPKIETLSFDVLMDPSVILSISRRLTLLKKIRLVRLQGDNLSIWFQSILSDNKLNFLSFSFKTDQLDTTSIITAINMNWSLKTLYIDYPKLECIDRQLITNNTLKKCDVKELYYCWSRKSSLKFIEISESDLTDSLCESMKMFHNNVIEVTLNLDENAEGISKLLFLNLPNLKKIHTGFRGIEIEPGNFIESLKSNRYINTLVLTNLVHSSTLCTILDLSHPSLTSLTLGQLVGWDQLTTIVKFLINNRNLNQFSISTKETYSLDHSIYLDLICSIIKHNNQIHRLKITPPDRKLCINDNDLLHFETVLSSNLSHIYNLNICNYPNDQPLLNILSKNFVN